MDIEQLRGPLIRLHGLTGADKVYTLYYDETQNVRRLHVTPEGLNVREPLCFVLGGIAHAGPPRDLGFESLRPALRLQASAPEMKFLHIAKGNLPSVLKSERLATLLEWLSAQGLFIHYQAMDPLYWATVDVIDSILVEADEPALSAIGPNLKSDLHTILRENMDDLVRLFQRYSYPNVGPDRRGAFIDELLERVTDRRTLIPEFNARMLTDVLQMARSLAALPALEWTEPKVLIEEFTHFYLNRLCMLRRSTHVLDTETRIMERLEATPLEDGGHPFRNYRFVETSESEIGVQISDVVVGLFGKFFAWAITSDRETVVETRRALSGVQEKNRSLMADLLDRSTAENEIFAHNIFSAEDQHKAALFLDAEGRRV